MANVAYVRVSTVEQNTGRQYEAFKNNNIEIYKYFEDKISGKNITDRQELKNMLNFVREGDTVYIESISRLARTVADFLKLVKILDDKKVGLVSLKENIDTTSAQGKFITTVFAALYELERATILQRQREGIDLCLKEGRAYGRPKDKFSPSFPKNYKRWRNKELRTNEFMNLEGIVARRTFYDKVHRYEERILKIEKVVYDNGTK